jgi:CIC family chloride channel protein
VLIIIEMTRGYSLILPLMIANMTAYVLARRFRTQSVYEALLEQDGIKLKHPSEFGEIQSVSSLLGGRPLVALSPGTPGEEVLLRCGAPDGKHVFPVVDAERHLLGVISQEELVLLGSSPELRPITTAYDLMRPAVAVRAGDGLAVAIERMLTSGLRELPVTDDDGRLLGYVDDQAISETYQRRAPPPVE